VYTNQGFVEYNFVLKILQKTTTL